MKECVIYGAGISGQIARLCLEGYHGYCCKFFIDDNCAKDAAIDGILLKKLDDCYQEILMNSYDVIIASEQFLFHMEKKLKEKNISYYKIFHYQDYLENPKYSFTPDIDLSKKVDDINSVVNMFSDNYSVDLYQYLIKLRAAGRMLVFNKHDHYFSFYTPEKDDIIIDCGAAAGLFTAKADVFLESGHIFAFEPDTYFFKQLSGRFKQNQHITPINAAVYKTSGSIQFDLTLGHGCNRIDEKDGKHRVETVCIDDFVETYKLPRVNFIKMDIEGAEPDAIIGARETIKRFRPAMAISIYHDINHFWEIPLILKSISEEYEYYLRHHDMTLGETTLYLVPKN